MRKDFSCKPNFGVTTTTKLSGPLLRSRRAFYLYRRLPKRRIFLRQLWKQIPKDLSSPGVHYTSCHYSFHDRARDALLDWNELSLLLFSENILSVQDRLIQIAGLVIRVISGKTPKWTESTYLQHAIDYWSDIYNTRRSRSAFEIIMPV